MCYIADRIAYSIIWIAGTWMNGKLILLEAYLHPAFLNMIRLAMYLVICPLPVELKTIHAKTIKSFKSASLISMIVTPENKGKKSLMRMF